MFANMVLENKKRKDLFLFIKANPGLHLREIQRRLIVPISTLNYHLKYMEKRKIIFGEKNKQLLRYYATPICEGDKKNLLVLRQDGLKKIILTLLN